MYIDHGVALYGCARSRRAASVRHEQNRVPVVVQTGVNAGQVSLSQFDQLILVLADDGFPARTRNVCLHVAAFPFAFPEAFSDALPDAFPDAAAFICFLYDRT